MRHYTQLLRLLPSLLATTIDYMNYGIVYPMVAVIFTQVPEVVFPGIGSKLALQVFLGLGLFLHPFMMFFGAPFLGFLSDIYGRRKMLIVSLCGIYIGYFLISMGISYHLLFLFLIGRAVSGLFAGTLALALAAIVDLSPPKSRAWNMTLVGATNWAGISLGAIIAWWFTRATLFRELDFPLPFIAAAFLALIMIFVILLFFEETLTLKEKKQYPGLAYFTKHFILRLKTLKMLAIAMFFIHLGSAFYYQQIGLYLHQAYFYPSSTLFLYCALLAVFCVISNLVVIPFFLRRVSIETILIAGAILMGILVVASIGFKNELYIWLEVMPLGAANAAAFTGLMGVFSQVAEEKKRGETMGLFASLLALAFLIAGLTASLLPTLDARWLIALGGIFIISGGAVMTRLKRGLS